MTDHSNLNLGRWTSILPTGGHVPSHMIKHIYFEEDETCRKFVFPNEKPTQGWEEYEVPCENNKTSR